MINLIFIFSYKIEIEDQLKKEIPLYLTLKATNKKFKLPDYLLIENKLSFKKDYTLFNLNGEKYIYIKSSYIKDKLKDKLFIIFYWDMIAIFSVAILYYLVLYRLIIKEKNYLKNFEILLLIFSHKLRNFLTTSKLNLHLIKTENRVPLERLIHAHENLTKDLENIQYFIKRLPTQNQSKNKINIPNLIKSLMDELELNKHFSIKFNFSEIYINAPYQDIYFALYLLFDNILKHAGQNVTIKCGKIKKLKYLIIKNDINENETKGLGVGLNVVEKLLTTHGFKIKRKITSTFTIAIKF